MSESADKLNSNHHIEGTSRIWPSWSNHPAANSYNTTSFFVFVSLVIVGVFSNDRWTYEKGNQNQMHLLFESGTCWVVDLGMSFLRRAVWLRFHPNRTKRKIRRDRILFVPSPWDWLEGIQNELLQRDSIATRRNLKSVYQEMNYDYII